MYDLLLDTRRLRVRILDKQDHQMFVSGVFVVNIAHNQFLTIDQLIKINYFYWWLWIVITTLCSVTFLTAMILGIFLNKVKSWKCTKSSISFSIVCLITFFFVIILTYHYCTTSFNKVWTRILRRFKPCSWRVRFAMVRISDNCPGWK